jgi:polar amino acid transport system substrate-binding protein
MRRRQALGLAGGLLLGGTAGAACARPLRVGVSLLGWGAYEEGGRLRGIVPDLVAGIAQRSRCQLELNLRPRARVMLDFQNGSLDLVTSAMRTADRDSAGDFLPYAFSGFDLVIREELAARIGSVAALEAEGSLRLGLVRGIQLTPTLMAATERLIAAGRVEWASDYRNLAARLQAGRFQAGVMPTVIHGKLRQDGALPDWLRVTELSDSPPQPIGLYLQRRLPEAQRRRLTEVLRAMVREREIERIYARYIGEARTRHLFEAGRAAAGSLPI